jgi:hypothetical protein
VLAFSGITPSRHWSFHTAADAVVASVSPRFTTNSPEVAIAAALAGYGDLVLSYMVARRSKPERLSPSYRSEPPLLPARRAPRGPAGIRTGPRVRGPHGRRPPGQQRGQCRPARWPTFVGPSTAQRFVRVGSSPADTSRVGAARASLETKGTRCGRSALCPDCACTEPMRSHPTLARSTLILRSGRACDGQRWNERLPSRAFEPAGTPSESGQARFAIPPPATEAGAPPVIRSRADPRRPAGRCLHRPVRTLA